MPDISGRGRGDELVEVVVETPTPPLRPARKSCSASSPRSNTKTSARKRKSFFEKLRDYFTEEADEPTSSA